MNKIDLGHTLGILANFGVLLGILLLAYELNQNRQMMQAQIRNSVAETRVNLSALEASSPELTDVILKQNSGELLSAKETSNLHSLYEAYWRYRENVYFQYLSGLYDEDEYLSLRNAWVVDLNAQEAARTTYCRRRSVQPESFTAEIDPLMERPC